MTIEEFYAVIGGDYQEALTRLMKDSLIERFVLKFENDPSFKELSDFLAAQNTEEAFRAAHTLKGVCRNLAFAKLGDSASEITEMLRAGNLEEALTYFPTVQADYDTVISTLAVLKG